MGGPQYIYTHKMCYLLVHLAVGLSVGPPLGSIFIHKVQSFFQLAVHVTVHELLNSKGSLEQSGLCRSLRFTLQFPQYQEGQMLLWSKRITAHCRCSNLSARKALKFHIVNI